MIEINRLMVPAKLYLAKVMICIVSCAKGYLGRLSKGHIHLNEVSTRKREAYCSGEYYQNQPFVSIIQVKFTTRNSVLLLMVMWLECIKLIALQLCIGKVDARLKYN